jgi:hypothetical protein
VSVFKNLASVFAELSAILFFYKNKSLQTISGNKAVAYWQKQAADSIN